jgi:hypothetical protein
MADQNEHTALTAEVVQAHEDMTSRAPTPVEYGTIQAVVRDYLDEEKPK